MFKESLHPRIGPEGIELKTIMKRLAFITYLGEPQLTDDDRLAMIPLEKLGYTVTPLIWDFSSSLEDFDAIIFRSCWDYHFKHRDFLDWLKKLRELNIPVLNPIDICIWNLNKSYLLDLERKGVLIPKTKIIKNGQAAFVDFGEFDTQVVIKPAISLNGLDTHLIPLSDKDRIVATIHALSEDRDVLIQQYLPEIKSDGEISLIFFNGSFSHAIKKVPAINEFRIHQEYGGTRCRINPERELILQAEKIVHKVGCNLLSCRVDVVLRDNKAYLIELEIIDPMLFLGFADEAPHKFACAIHESLRIHASIN